MYTTVYVAVIACELIMHDQQYVFDMGEQVKGLVAKLSTLTSFLLAFYVGLSMTRWWRLRTDGVGGIWGANNNIAPLLGVIYHSTKRASPSSAKRILSAMERIRRYSAASLYYFFLKSGQKGFDEDGLLRLGLLTQTELRTMQSLPGTQSEYLWGVIGTECGQITNVMSSLSDHGLNPWHSAVWTDKLSDLWMKGRSAAGLIAAQLGCQVLYDYASLVPLLVKVSNVAIFMTHAVMANKHHNVLESDHLLQSLRNMFLELLPLLFYALMLDAIVSFAVRVQSPFDDDRTAFPGFRYVNGLLEDFDIICNVDMKKEKIPMTPLHEDSGGGLLTV